MSSVRNDQITCQMFFFKHYFSFIFLVSVLTFCSCKNLKNEDNDYIKEIEVIRFEKLFFEYDIDSISSLKNKFPYLFPKQFSINDWKNIYNDTLRRDVFKRSDQVFKNFNPYKIEISKNIKQIQNEFGGFDIPKIITINNGIDYNYNVVRSDSIVLVSTDCYLGNNIHYESIPNYISMKMNVDYFVKDITESFLQDFIKYPSDRRFISKIIYHGKLIYSMNKITDFDFAQIIGISQENLNWLTENEFEIWEYFVKNNIIFSTDISLDKRFINDAPYSKFGLSIDFDSSPMVGKWIGYNIVKSYQKKNNIELKNLVAMNEYNLYLKSNYSPRK